METIDETMVEDMYESGPAIPSERYQDTSTGKNSSSELSRFALEDVVRERPVSMFLAAVAVGYLGARMFR